MNETPPTTDNSDKPPQRPKSQRKRQDILEPSATGPGEEWMLTYMDTVTLLVTLFVMILSFASFDKKKYEEFSHGMSLAKYGSGIMMGTLGNRDFVDDIVAVPPPENLRSKPKEIPQMSLEVPTSNVFAELKEEISRQGLTRDVQVHIREGTIDLEINENVLFPLGSADLSGSGILVLKKLTDLLIRQKGDIAVEGHTDSLPIETEKFPSNWDLSGGRASSVVRHFISGGISPRRLQITGYADTRPLASNDTPEGRQRNRRVNIILKLPAESPRGQSVVPD